MFGSLFIRKRLIAGGGLKYRSVAIQIFVVKYETENVNDATIKPYFTGKFFIFNVKI